MIPAKQEALDVISKLPDTATIDEIMYHLYVLEKVRKGKDAADRNETMTTEDLKKELLEW